MVNKQRISAFVNLGKILGHYVMDKNNLDLFKNLTTSHTEFNHSIEKTTQNNPWFTESNILFCFDAWSKLLTEEKLDSWVSLYKVNKKTEKQNTIGLILAGNIPMVGFHDLLCVLITNNKASMKLSSKDNILIPLLVKLLINYDPTIEKDIIYIEKLTHFDAVIATGSNNTAKYFKHYFAKHPHIIRKSRTSVAVLDGNESAEDLNGLSNDILLYFGLGCRSVTKLYLPINYDINLIFKALYHWSFIGNHHKFCNNYDYYKTIALMNQENILDNGFLILKESIELHTPIGIVNFDYYDNVDTLKVLLENQKEQIQCLVTNLKNDYTINFDAIPFGNSQTPTLTDYADGIDTMRFLIDL